MNSILDYAVLAGFVILGLALLLAMVRLLRGPSLPDRVVALELIASITVGVIGLYAIRSGKDAYIDVTMVLALTAFLTAIGFARYLERGGQRHDQ
ncbi:MULTISPECIES: monovalent cation/H+ antiporter complex subunit F [Alishewanella]|uniref:Multiple resistance and pH regulation protein F n=2 Tax=Alishewanella TaxID=111142 RepID=H3ZD54_9ALTE|nr:MULTISPECIES: cation:proton antiporter [Alishewanella]EHR41487.1 multiple resistance and pH regulation protein F [Alishewanella jeotgali KCTC 22429]EJI86588.1 multiple resistance and pH regulation protein F [Alishewanella aestuarii B11]